MEAEYVAISECAQEVKFVSMLLEECFEVQKPVIFHRYNQGDILLENNRQVDMHAKNIDIYHHFMRDMLEEKDIDVKYIRSEENPADIMINNCSEA